MNMEQVFAQFCKVSPLPVMARIAIEQAPSNEFLDSIFAESAERQVSSELLFSTVVKLMTLVACRVRPSINAAYQKNAQEIGVSLQAVYGKLRKIEPQVTRALVRETAARFAGVATRQHALILTIKSDRNLSSPRIHKSEQTSAQRFHHQVKLNSPAEVDSELLKWLKDAYALSE